jgi:multidrug efflux system membrane fusion protein
MAQGLHRQARNLEESPVRTDSNPRFWRRRRIVFVLIIFAVLGTGGLALRYWAGDARGVPPAVPGARPAAAIPVRVAVAGRQDFPIYVTGLGTVQASFTIGIHSQLDGIMQTVLFTEGQHVKKGDLLAQIDRRPFQAVFDAAVAKKAQDAAMLISAEKDLGRAKALVVRSFETQQVVDQQQAKVDQLKAAIEADEASIEGARTNLDFTSIRAPSDGRVGVRQIDPGNLVHASDTREIASLVLTASRCQHDRYRQSHQGAAATTRRQRSRGNQGRNHARPHCDNPRLGP